MKFYRDSMYHIVDEIDIDIEKEWEDFKKDFDITIWDDDEIEWEKTEGCYYYDEPFGIFLRKKYCNRLPNQDSHFQLVEDFGRAESWMNSYGVKE